MDKPDEKGESSRRSFLKGIAGMPVVALTGGKSLLRSASELPPSEGTKESALPQSSVAGSKKKFVAIQIGARSFVDEGVEKCLDTLQEKGGVNTLMSTVFTYGRGLAGRQVPGQPLPDHGVQEYDKVHGGSYTKVHPEFYANSVIKDVRAPDLADFDI